MAIMNFCCLKAGSVMPMPTFTVTVKSPFSRSSISGSSPYRSHTLAFLAGQRENRDVRLVLLFQLHKLAENLFHPRLAEHPQVIFLDDVGAVRQDRHSGGGVVQGPVGLDRRLRGDAPQLVKIVVDVVLFLVRGLRDLGRTVVNDVLGRVLEEDHRAGRTACCSLCRDRLALLNPCPGMQAELDVVQAEVLDVVQEHLHVVQHRHLAGGEYRHGLQGSVSQHVRSAVLVDLRQFLRLAEHERLAQRVPVHVDAIDLVDHLVHPHHFLILEGCVASLVSIGSYRDRFSRIPEVMSVLACCRNESGGINPLRLTGLTVPLPATLASRPRRTWGSFR
jgi:hypothetical protein